MAILAAFLMPTIRHARELARRAVCMNTQRQIVMVFHLYGYDQMRYPSTPGGVCNSTMSLRGYVALELKDTYGLLPESWFCPSSGWGEFCFDHYADRMTREAWIANPVLEVPFGYEKPGGCGQGPKDGDHYGRLYPNGPFPKPIPTEPTDPGDWVMLADVVQYSTNYPGLWAAYHAKSGAGSRNWCMPSDAIAGGYVTLADGSVRWKQFRDMTLNYICYDHRNYW